MTHSPPKASKFRGGIDLPPEKQGLDKAIVTLALPPTLIFKANDPIVAGGDTVTAGQALAADVVASTSGLITQIIIDFHGDAFIELEPDGLNTLSDSLINTSSALEAIGKANIAGLGGAGFSTVEKLQSQKSTALATLVINACECEPMIACDEALMIEQAAEIMLGITALIDLTQSKHCIIAIEDNKPKAISAMQQAMASYAHKNLTLELVTARYPGGAETVLLRQLTGLPITKTELPAEHNILCFNVATAHSVHSAITRQPDFSRVVSIAGDAVSNACNVRALFGTPLPYVLEQTGNKPDAGTTIKTGGPLSGVTVDNDTATLSRTSIDAKTNAVVLQTIAPAALEQPCIRCGDCADVCPEQLLPQQLFRYQHDYDQLNTHRLDQCIECRCCDLVCPSSIALTDYFRASKQFQEEQRQIANAAELAESRYAARETRLARKAKEREQQLIEKKRAASEPAKPAALDIKAALARAKANANKPAQSDDAGA